MAIKNAEISEKAKVVEELIADIKINSDDAAKKKAFAADKEA